MIVIGSHALQRADSAALHSIVSTISQTARVGSGCGEDWKVLNVLHRVRGHVYLSVSGWIFWNFIFWLAYMTTPDN